MRADRLRRLAESWTPRADDELGHDKRLLVSFLLDRNTSASNPVTLTDVLSKVRFSKKYRREELQHALLGPLRRESKLFIGTSSKGIFIVTTPEDIDATLGFYTWRIRAELRHARNLRALAKRVRAFEHYRSDIPADRESAVIYLDESGNPDIEDRTPPVLVIGAVVIQSRKAVASLDQRFRNAFSAIRRPEAHELRTAGLSVAKHAAVLHELSLLDYQWAAACFDKRKLTSAGFKNPKTFYKYAFQFLIGDLLTIAWQADLVIDEHSTSAFQEELEGYLRRQNSGLPLKRLGTVKFSTSSKVRLTQLADLVAGAVRRSVAGEEAPLGEIEHRMINLQTWPPR